MRSGCKGPSGDVKVGGSSRRGSSRRFGKAWYEAVFLFCWPLSPRFP